MVVCPLKSSACVRVIWRDGGIDGTLDFCEEEPTSKIWPLSVVPKHFSRRTSANILIGSHTLVGLPANTIDGVVSKETGGHLWLLVTQIYRYTWNNSVIVQTLRGTWRWAVYTQSTSHACCPFSCYHWNNAVVHCSLQCCDVYRDKIWIHRFYASQENITIHISSFNELCIIDQSITNFRFI